MTKIGSFCLMLLVSNFLPGQNKVVLDSVLVSASRFETTLQSSNRNVVVLNRKDIEQIPVNSISELLDFVVGIDARQRGIFGGQTDLSIRGSSFEQVLVLLNGTRLSDPQTGHHLMNLPISKSDIEKIEILLGGGSYIFGGSAFSGAVNIITRKPEEDRTELQIAGGSYGSYQGSYSQTLSGKKHNILLSATTTGSEGFKENTDFHNTTLFGQGRVNVGEDELNISGGYSWQGFGAQNFYSDLYPEQYEKTRTLFVNAGLKSTGKVEIDRQVYWRRNRDEFQLFREGEGFYRYDDGFFIKGMDTAANWYSGHNYHRSDVVGARLGIKFSSSAGKTSLNGVYNYEQVISNNLGEPLEAAVNIEGSRGKYTLGDKRQNISLGVEQAKSWGKFDLSGALLINYNTSYLTDFYPAINAGYSLNKKHKIYGSINRSFRLPSYTDLYYRLGGAVGSKTLKPENSLNYEVGYKFYNKYLFANMSIFRREGKNIIDWIQYCDTCELRAANTSEVNFNGADISVRLANLEVMNTLRMEFLELGYSHLFTDHFDPDYQSLYVFNYLTDKVTVRAGNTLMNNLVLSYSLSYQNRNGQYVDESGTARNYPDVILINAKLAYTWKTFTMHVAAQNLLNKTYFDRGNVELPGLWLWGGLGIKL